MADSSHDRQDDTPYNDSDSRNNTQLRGPKLLLIIFIGGATTVFLIIFLGIIAILRLRQNLNRHSGSNSSTSSVSSSGIRERGASRQEVLATMSYKSNGTSDAGNVYHPEQDDECCCDNDMSEEILLTSTSNQQQHANHSNKGPPDIIPALGYCVVASHDKQYLYGEFLSDANCMLI